VQKLDVVAPDAVAPVAAPPLTPVPDAKEKEKDVPVSKPDEKKKERDMPPEYYEDPGGYENCDELTSAKLRKIAMEAP